MRLSALLILVTALGVNAFHPSGLSARHAHLSHRDTPFSSSHLVKRCPVRHKPKENLNITNGKANNKPQAGGSPTSPPPPSGGNGLFITGPDSACGFPGATPDPQPTTGPNGRIDYLNCGISGSGWQPPELKVDTIVFKNLHEVLARPGNPFERCSPFIGLFEQYGGEFHVPPILLAAFAMQESSCNPEVVGQGGEQGLMQISAEKCDPGVYCRDPAYNIRTATRYFADSLARNNGNFLVTLGGYNGWFPGMTYGQATAAAYTACCMCQNNLDYLHQVMNGWLQGVDPRNLGMRVYNNLAVCPGYH